MSFQVRDFQADEGDALVWKFKLGNLNNSQIDFYSQEQSVRALKHLAQDINLQVEQALKGKQQPNQINRTVRKLTEAIIKALSLPLNEFAQDIGEQTQQVRQFFGKGALQTAVLQRVREKCKKWVISVWLSLTPEQFYKTTRKYLDSYVKDGKKLNSDFQLLNQLYIVTLGDNFNPKEEETATAADNLILIDINLNVDDKYVSESLLWDSEEVSNMRIKGFASYFLRDILEQQGIQLEREQLLELEKDTYTQIRTQILYKTLLKKYAGMLLNFTSMDIPAEAKQYMIPISINLEDKGHTIYEDSFEWDILNENNSVSEFVQGLISDEGLPQRYYSELSYKIRTQINQQLQWKLDLLIKTFKSIHRDRQSPKLNTQTIAVLRKNVSYAMDVTVPSADPKYKLHKIYFNNSDLFSLLSRNIDILPEDFQDILLCKEGKGEKEQTGRPTKQEANNYLTKAGLTLDNNNYIPSFCPKNNLHNLWRKNVAK